MRREYSELCLEQKIAREESAALLDVTHSKTFDVGGGGMRQRTVRVHLHHDHRNGLVADPDDPGTSLPLSGLLIGRGSRGGVGVSLAWLIRRVGRRQG